MTLDEIQKEWGVDCVIDKTDLINSQINQNVLKHKYMTLRSEARLQLRVLEFEATKLRHLKTQYFLGELPLPVLRELGWEPNARRIIKTEIGAFLEADEDVIKHNLKLATGKEKVDYLEEVVKSLTYVNNMIKNILDSKKFDAGIR